MTQTITVIPELVTATGTANEELTINEAILNRMGNPIIFIEEVSGTFKFAVGQDASRSLATWGADDKVPPLSLRSADRRRGALHLNFSNAAAGSQFKITGV